MKFRRLLQPAAYGLGINKKNIQQIVYFGAPRDVLRYYQEIGREGRDGETSYCQMFYSNAYFSIHRLSQPSGAMSNNMAVDHSKHVESIIKAYLTTSQCRRKELLGNSDESENLKACLISAEYD